MRSCLAVGVTDNSDSVAVISKYDSKIIPLSVREAGKLLRAVLLISAA